MSNRTSLVSGATTMFATITHWSVYALFFLIPLFFLPWTSSVLELNKQLLLVLLTCVGVVSWLGQMVLQKRLTFRSGWMNVLPLVFLSSVLISSFLSFAGYQTWVGQASQEYTSFLSIAVFISLYYLLTNTAGSSDVQKGIFSSLLLSVTLSGLLLIVGLFDWFHLPFSFAASKTFNTVGTLNGFILFATSVMFLGLAMWLVSQEGKTRVIASGIKGDLVRTLILLVTLLTLTTQLISDFWVFWVVNLVGVVFLALFAFLQSHEFPHPKRFWLPLFVFFFSVVFLFVQSPVVLNLPVVVSPSYTTSWNIVVSTVSRNVGDFLFGSGPGTFSHDYLAFKPASVNASPFWNVSFDRAKSSVMTILATLGVVGFVSWFVLMAWLAVKGFLRLLLEQDHEEWKMTYVVFTGWAVACVSSFLYSSNMTQETLFWGLSGLLASQVLTKVWKTDFTSSPVLGLFATMKFLGIGVGLILCLFFTSQRFLAEVAFAKALQAEARDAKIEEVIALLSQAVSHNELSDVYLRNLASAQLAQAKQTIASFEENELTPEQTQKVADQVKAAIASATKATAIEPNSVANWVLRGVLYRDVMSFAQGAEDLAARMFLNAIKIEPNNPAHRVDLGRVYLTVADRARALKTDQDTQTAKTATEQETALLKTAEQAFLSAIQLKSDYAPAHYYLAGVYERQGRIQEAAARLLVLRNDHQTDIGVGFQLASMLIRLERYDLATQELERILKLNPTFSNGLWYLASLYEIDNRQKEALDLVAQVVKLNPGNKVAKERLSKLKAGGVTTVIPEPIQPGQEQITMPPVQEVIEEEPSTEESVLVP